jgi:Tfp pilus assembly protein PilX
MTDVWQMVIGALLGLCGFLSVWVLNRISRDMSDIKGSLGALEKDLRHGIHTLDRRVTVIETRCETHRREGQ